MIFLRQSFSPFSDMMQNRISMSSGMLPSGEITRFFFANFQFEEKHSTAMYSSVLQAIEKNNGKWG